MHAHAKPPGRTNTQTSRTYVRPSTHKSHRRQTTLECTNLPDTHTRTYAHARTNVRDACTHKHKQTTQTPAHTRTHRPPAHIRTHKPHRRTQTRSLTRARTYLFESGGNDLVFRSNHQSHQSRERKWHQLNKSAKREKEKGKEKEKEKKKSAN